MQYLAGVNHPVPCFIDNRSTRVLTRLVALDVLIVHILSWENLATAQAMKHLSEVNGDYVAVDRISQHRLGRLAPVPQTTVPIVNGPLRMPFSDVGTDTGLGCDDPHPAKVTGPCPLTFMDDDHSTTLASTSMEIVLVDPYPSNLDGTCTLTTSTTCDCLLWGPIKYGCRLPLVMDDVRPMFGGYLGR